DKIEEYSQKYNTLFIIQNAAVPNKSLQELRAAINGKVIFVKKSILMRKYSKINMDGECFLIFADEEDEAKIKDFRYPCYASENDVSASSVVIPVGRIQNTKLLEFLDNVEEKGTNHFLTKEFLVCDENQKLDAKQAQILQAMGIRFGTAALKIAEIVSCKELPSMQ
ncbi:hypothetical protein ENBRE01_0855, partial [Enteropsectra breve]